jgi:hypothetical protein
LGCQAIGFGHSLSLEPEEVEQRGAMGDNEGEGENAQAELHRRVGTALHAY